MPIPVEVRNEMLVLPKRAVVYDQLCGESPVSREQEGFPNDLRVDEFAQEVTLLARRAGSAVRKFTGAAKRSTENHACEWCRKTHADSCQRAEGRSESQSSRELRTANVSHWRASPLSKPRPNHRLRCSLEPCVNVLSSAWPRVSSPIACAALSASLRSSSVIWSDARAVWPQTPARQSAWSSSRTEFWLSVSPCTFSRFAPIRFCTW